MDTVTIARLLEPFISLDEHSLRLTSTYIDLLVKWNARINLTAVRDPEEMVTRHFGESFFAARIFAAHGAARQLVDVGSGAGFPGLPLAMLLPAARVTLIEANGKKVTFLREVIRALDLKNVSVFAGRAEDYSMKADLVTLRAVERFAEVLPTAVGLLDQGLLGPGSRIALMIGASQADTARSLGAALEWEPPVAIPGGHSRLLLIGTRDIKVE